MNTPTLEKAQATAAAIALLEGIHVELSRSDRGVPTLVLSRGAWCREVEPSGVREAIAELRKLESAVPA